MGHRHCMFIYIEKKEAIIDKIMNNGLIFRSGNDLMVLFLIFMFTVCQKFVLNNQCQPSKLSYLLAWWFPILVRHQQSTNAGADTDGLHLFAAWK